MSEEANFMRLNYFTGLFLTAKDFSEEQEYLLRKRRLHNRGLHTPGVVRSELEQLRVRSAGGLTVEVRPGVALDAQGREICLWEPRTLTVNPATYTLPKLIYIAISYAEEIADHRENVAAPQYSGDARIAEVPRLEVTPNQPDNKTAIELARIDLQPGVTAVSDLIDKDKPGPNQIDRRAVLYAGAVAAPAAGEGLTADQMIRLIQLMQRKRRDFAALARRFPVPSTEDVRHAALTVELLARIGCLEPEGLPGVLAAMAAVEQDVAQELGAAFPVLPTLPEYVAYQAAVATLLKALQDGRPLDTLLNCQDAVAQAARELAEVVLELPVADAGADQAVVTAGTEVAVTLNASASKAFGGRQVKQYAWTLKTMQEPPVADAGADRTVTTLGAEATVSLDAGGSQASGGRQITTYRWDEQAG